MELPERMSDKKCRLVMEKVTTQEATALTHLSSYGQKKGWLAEPLNLKSLSGSADLAAPIEKVAKILAKTLKPGRTLISAVKFSNGRLTEVNDADYDNGLGTIAAPPADEEKPEAAPYSAVNDKREKPEPKAATTVAAPVLGCPAPDFPSAELKARAVLETFLDEEQFEDFRKYNRFIAIGGVTGHRYMITSRHARDQLRLGYQRSLFDLDEDKPFCVHDWGVPAAEEMLALGLLVQLPAHEGYLRHLE